MDHWFDELSKQFAAGKPTRRSLIAGLGAMAAVAGNGSNWSGALAATRVNAGTSTAIKYQKFPGATAPLAKTRKFGPCTATSAGNQYDHDLTSTARASGRTAVLHAKRAIDTKGQRTFEQTVLIDGKQQIKITAVAAKPGTTQTLEYGDAFGFGSAKLTTTDRGKTFRGTIGGRAIVPYTVGSGKLQFAGGGKPKKGTPLSGAQDAVKAVYAKAASDLRVCTSSAHADVQPAETMALGPYRAEGSHARQLAASGPTYYWGYGGRSMTTVSTEAFFNQGCENCANNCGVSLFTGVVTTISCAVSIFEDIISLGLAGLSDCEAVANYSQQQVDCVNACYKSSTCAVVNCNLGTWGSCVRGQVCMTPNLPGLCCPSGYSVPCGDYGALTANATCNFYAGFCGDYSQLIESFCCPAADTCIYDLSPATASQNGAGIMYCCPQGQFCGKKTNGTNLGTCCPHGTTCAKDARTVSTEHNLPICCPNNDSYRDNKCCPSQYGWRWCGDTCCSGPCNGDKCAVLCLSGTVCGKACCEYGCADAKTSTCKKGVKCKKGFTACNSYASGSSKTVQVCCEHGRSCYNGACCPKNTTACTNKSGTMGCWPASQCQPVIIK